MKQFSDVNARFGAPMGRYSVMDDDSAKVHLFRVKFVDGDYDDGGAYWGGGSALYCARDDAGQVQQFLRVRTREKAKAQLKEEFPNLRFFR